MRALAYISLSLAIAVAIATGLGGCGTDEDNGSAPVLSNLTYTPQSIATGLATITGTFDFTDSDADVTMFSVSATNPSGLTTVVGPSPAQGVLGKTIGTVGFALQLNATTAGTYVLELWMTDDAGLDSNKLTGNVTAQ